ncbi:MAG: hypothetical protein ACRD7E_17565 [Bryobacteraceae bacterium]
MFAGPAEFIEVAEDQSGLDRILEALPPGPAVFLLWPEQGRPYLGKTALLRRRLKRMLRARQQPSRLLNLRNVVRRIEYRPVASQLEGHLVLYELARQHVDEYLKFLKLRMPPYVKLILSNPFPRTQVTSRITGGAGRYYGPFRARVSAETFEHQFLDLFQLRRCQEDLTPSPDHPGCIYGEMGMCLRPCQQVVSQEEYASETARVSEFLSTSGRNLKQTAEAARDRLSAEMNFEEAARQHKRIEKIDQVLKQRDELVADAGLLCGVAVTPSLQAESVNLWFVLRGAWLAPRGFRVAASAEGAGSLDHRLREVAAGLSSKDVPLRERQEHLALLARWYYSTWREGEWLPFGGPEEIPYRKLVGAISRVAAASAGATKL